MGGAFTVVLGSLAHPLELFLEFLQFFIGKILEIDELIARVFDCSNQFVQFQMNCFGIAVLRVLNQKHHQEGDNGRGGIYDQLPSIGEMKRRAGEDPNEDDEHLPAKGPGAAKHDGRMACENSERVTDNAKEIAFSLVFLKFLGRFVHRATLTYAPEFPIARMKRAGRFLSFTWQD